MNVRKIYILENKDPSMFENAQKQFLKCVRISCEWYPQEHKP